VLDVRWAVRALRRAPAPTVAAVLTLALGIGVNAAIFTVVRAQLLRPLPYPHADRLVWIFESSRTFLRGEQVDATEVSVEAWRRHSRLLDGVATFVTSRRILTGQGEAEELGVGAVSPELFELLGVSAWRGRLFSAAECQRGRDGVVVLSHAFWQRRFSGNEQAVGRPLALGGRVFTVVGVLPEGFGFAPLDRPRYAWLAPRDTDVWVPVSTESSPGQAADRYYLGVLGRLKPGIARTVAQDELSRIAGSVSGGRSGAVILGLQDELVKSVRMPLLLLTGAAGFVLLIVCANVAHLQLARGMGRSREMAIRVAVGAGRGRLVRQLLVESAVLGVTGGILGLLAVDVSLPAVLWVAGSELPAHPTVAVDGWVFAFALAASLGAAVLFGVLPARQAARADPQRALKEGGRDASGQTHRTTSVLVVAEIALALVLVTCAGLMINTVWRLVRAPVGFQPDHLVTLHLRLPRPYLQDGRSAAFVDESLARVRALPGVEAADAANTLPMGGAPTFSGFRVVGAPDAPDAAAAPRAQYRVVTPGYFKAMGIPLRQGRTFTDGDRRGGPGVAIVNETMACTYFDGNAIGRRLVQGTPKPVEVVGVVGDIRHESLRSEPLPEIYHPFSQRETASPWLVVRSASDTDGATGGVRAVLRAMEPNAAVTEVKTMGRRRAESLGTSRFLVLLLMAFSGLALLLALIGSYGVVSYRVSCRRPEFGVRLALGAPATHVVRLVLAETLTLTIVAVAIGTAGAIACTGLLSSYLYRVEPTDPVTMIAAVGLVAVTALAAAYLPARRAAATDPVVVLRQE
jgi:putative ABC transport system permease protein